MSHSSNRTTPLAIACAAALATVAIAATATAAGGIAPKTRGSNIPTTLTPKAAATAIREDRGSVRGPRISVGGLGSPGNERVSGFIVTYRDGVTTTAKLAPRAAQLDRAARSMRIGGKAVKVARQRTLGTGADLVRADSALNPAQAETLMRSIAADPNVESIAPDLWGQVAQNYAPYNTGDTEFTQQYYLVPGSGGSANIAPAWSLSTGAGVRVAVIDTGILGNHPELNGKIVGGYDFVSNLTAANDGNGRDADATDPGDGADAGVCGAGTAARNSTWHGTQMASIIAANTWNGQGIAGVAPSAQILNVRAFGRCGGLTSDVIDAITWASGGAVPGAPTNWTPAQVINISLTFNGLECPQVMGTAISNALNRGSVVVVAAGNDAVNTSGIYPANCNNYGSITVAGVDEAGNPASFSNGGSNVAFVAPATNIRVALNSGTRGPVANGMASRSGTSHAAAITSGVAALVLSRRPTINRWQVEYLLRFATADKFWSSTLGWGYLDGTNSVNSEYPNTPYFY